VGAGLPAKGLEQPLQNLADTAQSQHLRATAPNQIPASPDFGAVLPQANGESASVAAMA
jgi:hypothetical protein